MRRRLDTYWFRVLTKAHVWILRRQEALVRRELRRRLPRQVAWQKAHLN